MKFSWRAWCGYCASRDMTCLCVKQKVRRPLCKSISIHIFKNEISHSWTSFVGASSKYTHPKKSWMFSFWNVLDCSVGTLERLTIGKQTKDCSDVSLHCSRAQCGPEMNRTGQLSFCLRTNRLELCTHNWERILCKRLGNINCGYIILYIWKRQVK